MSGARVAHSSAARVASAVAAVGFQTLALYWPSPPDLTPGLTVPHLDKVVHFALFALATWALLRVLPARVVLVAMLVQVGLSEWVQGRFLAERSADPLDAAADLAGIAAGWGVWAFGAGRPAQEPKV